MFGIPQGEWIVVQRPVKYDTGKGFISRAGLTESQAKRIARENSNAQHPSAFTHNWWAMHRSSY